MSLSYINILCLIPRVLQAWAFASGTRLVMGKSPTMNMDAFPADIWNLHRKLFHRFLKYRKYFINASESIQENIAKMKRDTEASTTCAGGKVTSSSKTAHVICLLSSSEGEVSEDEEDSETVEDDEEYQDGEDDNDDEDGK